jgi:phospholipid/cholesterol/gamma-HCH transport system permease protein
MDAPVPPPASVTSSSVAAAERDGALVLVFRGRLEVTGIGRVWAAALRAAAQRSGKPLVLDLHDVALCDTAGATLLLAVERAHGGAPARLEGGPAGLADLFARVRAAGLDGAPLPRTKPFRFRRLARAMAGRAGDGLAFLGETATATARLPARQKMWRWPEVLRIADEAGVRAVPLVLLMGALMGLILSFQSLIPLRRFGADIYVSNLVAVSLLRELGPLLAAVVLSGRTGSAFAAEIGTMKVNEELDALSVLGLDPVTMLVLPRLVAATLVMPMLTILLEIAGMAGMIVVMDGFGFPPVAVLGQVARWVRVRDLWGGLFKAAVFGVAIAAIGCRSGLATGVGPRAVGVSATRAVVGGIVASVMLDGCFALIYWKLGF